MNAASRTLIRVTIPQARAAVDAVTGEPATGPDARAAVDDLVDQLMGKNADARFRFIQDRAEFAQDIDI